MRYSEVCHPGVLVDPESIHGYPGVRVDAELAETTASGLRPGVRGDPGRIVYVLCV